VFRAGQSDTFSGDSVFAPTNMSSDVRNPAEYNQGTDPVVGTTKVDSEFDGLGRLVLAKDNNEPGERQACDERILGGGEFVARTLKEAEEAERDRSRLRREGWTPERVLGRAGEVARIRPSMILGGGKRPAQALGRALACKWMIQDLGMKGADAARFLGISQPAVTIASRRGAQEESRLDVRLSRSGGEGA